MRYSPLAFALLLIVSCSPAEPRRSQTGAAGNGGAGITGAAGLGGDAGATGAAGSGDAGATGAAGSGDAGATGAAGSGDAGATGAAGSGDAGATGAAGSSDAGATGTAGSGDAGTTGAGGVDAAADSGAAGTTGAAGSGDASTPDAADTDAGADAASGADAGSSDGGAADVPTTATIQINAGSTDVVAPFVADVDFTGGTTIKHVNTIDLTGVTNPAPAAVYQTARTGTASYTIPGFTAGSTHLVRLHFAETYWTLATQRVFNLSLNGTAVLTAFDVVAAAGAANKAVIREFVQPAGADGAYTIQMTSVTDKALLSAIEIY